MSRRPALVPRKFPRQSRSTATVDAIVEATAQVLATHGYEGATTGRIAERAGTSVGSLYQYFPTKEALLVAVGERHLREMMAVFESLVPPNVADAPLEEGIHALVKAALDAHAAEPALHRVLTAQAMRIGELDFIVETEKMLVALVAGLLRQRSDLRDVDPELAAWIIVRTVEALTHSAVLDRPELLERPELGAEITHLVLAYVKKA
jgi:AcrR family transcriptional regulator